MGAVWFRYVSGLRRSWRAGLALSLACGMAFALPLAAAAGARRTSTVLTRYLAEQRAPDAAVAIDQSRVPAAVVSQLFDDVDRLPQVLATARVQGVFLEVIDDEGGFLPAFDFGSAPGKLVDERAIHEVGAFQLISGRFPAPTVADEVMINPEAARAGHWKIGDRVNSIRMFRISDFDADFNVDPSTKGEQLSVTIVGIAQRPDELVDDSEIRAPQVYLFPAFGREHPNVGFYIIDYVRLRNGFDDEPAFQRAAAALSGSTAEDPLQISSFGDAIRHTHDADRPLIVTIWLLAAVLFLASMMVSVQVIVRALDHHYDDVAELRALGASRRQITLAISLHAATVVVGAALVAVATGYLCSAWTPIGGSADIEVDRGLRFDGAVAVAGAIVLTLTLGSALVWWGWRAVARSQQRANGARGLAVPLSQSGSVGIMGHLRSGLLSSIAARFTFSGLHRSSSGSRSAIASAALGTALFIAALAFGSTLDRVLHTPQAHGWNWDIALINSFGAIPDDALQSIVDLDAVGESTAFTTGSLVIDGRRTSSLGLSLDGTVPLVLITGHLPRSSDEIVLGGTVLGDIGHSVGDDVEVVTPSGARPMTIVGVATFPAIGSTRFGSVSLGDGAATVASLLPSTDPSGTYNGVFVRVSPGGSRQGKVDEVQEVGRELGCTDEGCFLVDAHPPQLAGYDDLDAITVPLSAALGCLVALPLAYSVFTTVRHRRRDLAILRALGMTHRQVSMVITLCALGLATVSILIGTMLGGAIATIGWQLFSESLGIRWPVHLPVRVALVPGGALLVAVAAGAVVAALPRFRQSNPLR